MRFLRAPGFTTLQIRTASASRNITRRKPMRSKRSIVRGWQDKDLAQNDTIAPPLPASTDAERSVLGAILLDNGQFDVAAQKLEPEDFFDQRHVSIYRAMGRM